MKGLKQMVSEAIEAIEAEPEQAAPKVRPVHVSGEAQYALSQKMREWSGWRDSRTIPGNPAKMGMPSPYAACDHTGRTFVFNPDALVLNPNRVLLSITPFRLRQEAVLTGCLLHEAGHARFSHWQPGRYGNPMELIHGARSMHAGKPVTKQALALARLMEEPRIEGLMARDAKYVGAATLDWTMRAAAAHLLPVTKMSTDPNQQIMDLLTSWALRAARQYAIEGRTEYQMRHWVQDFTTLLSGAILAHLTGREQAGALNCNPATDTNALINLLISMTVCDDHTGSTMIDTAAHVLDLLFPETPGETADDEAMPGEGCGQAGEPSPSESGEQGEGDEEGQDGEGNTEPDDPGEGDDPGAGDAGSDETEQDPEDASSSTEGEAEPDEEGEPEQSEESGEGEASEELSELAQALAEMEAQSKGEVEAETEQAEEQAEQETANGTAGGSGGTKGFGGGWRNPTKDEREIQHGAERFLRTMIDTSQTSKVTLTEAPSSTVDAAALAAWKAGGQRNDPRFFRRTVRTEQPSPPVRIAVLVDISSSMDSLQKPSALLSWALTAAALDLRNFAGRGQQVESCLIHWGFSARTIQHPGEMLPGIKEHECNDGTSAMAEAMKLIETEMPGFYDITPTPVNRLIVQFTDWELWGHTDVVPWVKRAMESGVNMLTVAPENYRPRASKLSTILDECRRQGGAQRGSSSLLKYNPKAPQQVWQQAAKVLA